MTTHAAKTRAGMMLSRFLREIAEEDTELVKRPGGDIMATKAEALARLLWKCALGSEETHIDDNGKVFTKLTPPDLAVAKLLFERIEGKAAVVGDQEKELDSVAKKVTEQGKNRIAGAGKINEHAETP